MNFLHARARRFVAVALLVGGVVLAGALTLPARSANSHSSAANKVSFYHQTKLLGSIAVPSGSGLDVVWSDGTCSNGYVSPPVAFQWSKGTGATSAPIMAPCSKFQLPDNWECVLTINTSNSTWSFECHWTYKRGGSTSTAKIINPPGSTIGTLYLYKRTALYAYRITPGQPNKKISVPAGADTIRFGG
jgi:hypothetical protein